MDSLVDLLENGHRCGLLHRGRSGIRSQAERRRPWRVLLVVLVILAPRQPHSAHHQAADEEHALQLQETIGKLV